MLIDRRRFYPVPIYGTLASAAYVVSLTDNPVLGILGFLLTCIFAACGVVYFWVWVMDDLAALEARKRMTGAITPASELAEKLARLSKEALEIYKVLAVDRAGQQYDDEDYLMLDNLPVPSMFIRRLIADSTGDELPPIRNFGEGSRERRYYQALVDFLEKRDLVTLAMGNRPVRVKKWRDVMDAIENEGV
jgi:hypothetical protein